MAVGKVLDFPGNTFYILVISVTSPNKGTSIDNNLVFSSQHLFLECFSHFTFCKHSVYIFLFSRKWFCWDWKSLCWRFYCFYLLIYWITIPSDTTYKYNIPLCHNMPLMMITSCKITYPHISTLNYLFHKLVDKDAQSVTGNCNQDDNHFGMWY